VVTAGRLVTSVRSERERFNINVIVRANTTSITVGIGCLKTGTWPLFTLLFGAGYLLLLLWIGLPPVFFGLLGQRVASDS
jgi:hypothetical protein